MTWRGRPAVPGHPVAQRVGHLGLVVGYSPSVATHFPVTDTWQFFGGLLVGVPFVRAVDTCAFLVSENVSYTVIRCEPVRFLQCFCFLL